MKRRMDRYKDGFKKVWNNEEKAGQIQEWIQESME